MRFPPSKPDIQLKPLTQPDLGSSIMDLDGAPHGSTLAGQVGSCGVLLPALEEEGMDGEGEADMDRDGCLTLNAGLTLLLGILLLTLYITFA